MIMNLR